VQLYIRDLVGSVTRPVKELKDFKKVLIPSHETVEVTFVIDNHDLAFWRKDMTYGAEKGRFQLFIGTDSDVKESVEFELTASVDMDPYAPQPLYY